MEKKETSFQNQRDNNLISVAHVGSRFEVKEFKKTMKGKQVMKK